VGDIRDIREVDEVIDEYRVNSIFHAAAYKHVPLMQRQICEAVRNNVLGTWNLVQAAYRANVSNFLLISTDKAVNPTSIMGLTKRITELIISAERANLADERRTKFVAVRFGNVLVSNGSVVPIFQKQIASGGPVTVTHPEMRRYFMTVQEAVQLVLQASTMGAGGEIFVLDMGKPMKIIDLARKMITLAGFQPDDDIDIRITGTRPGEKLFEELTLQDENTLPTGHTKIRIFRGRHPVAFHELVPWITELQHLLWRRDGVAILKHMTALVPEFISPPEEALQEKSLAAAASAEYESRKAAAISHTATLAQSGLT
jgi:FlaA1/EpsC-like NDP-sugar epimerase